MRYRYILALPLALLPAVQVVQAAEHSDGHQNQYHFRGEDGQHGHHGQSGREDQNELADHATKSTKTIHHRDYAGRASGPIGNPNTTVNISVAEVARLVGEMVAKVSVGGDGGGGGDKYKIDNKTDRRPKDAVPVRPPVFGTVDGGILAPENFHSSLAQGAPPRYASFNRTAPDLWMRFFVGDAAPAACPLPFSANDTRDWVQITYGIPWRLAEGASNATNVTAWQVSRPLKKTETLYHAGYGFGFMAPEAGNMCGTNFPTLVGKAIAGPLINCTDLFLPVDHTRCVNVVLRDHE